ncbi:MAG: IS630 family transposase [Burkholderiales bacterium]
MARGKKNAARLNAWLVFIDESGLLMSPLVRRSWAPRGHTPVLYQRTRSHQKVSIIGALCVAPTRDHVQLYFRLHRNANVNAQRTVSFLIQLDRQLAAPFVLVWDRLQAHRATVVREFLLAHRHVRSVFLPPYAPELNPIEYLWAYLKMNPLANLPIFDSQELTIRARLHARSLQHQPDLLKSFVQHSPLSLRLK